MPHVNNHKEKNLHQMSYRANSQTKEVPPESKIQRVFAEAKIQRTQTTDKGRAEQTHRDIIVVPADFHKTKHRKRFTDNLLMILCVCNQRKCQFIIFDIPSNAQLPINISARTWCWGAFIGVHWASPCCILATVSKLGQETQTRNILKTQYLFYLLFMCFHARSWPGMQAGWARVPSATLFLKHFAGVCYRHGSLSTPSHSRTNWKLSLKV